MNPPAAMGRLGRHPRKPSGPISGMCPSTAFIQDSGKPRLLCTRGMAAYDYKDGKLTKRWSRLDTSDGNGIFGEGFHNMSVADVDNDGYDEIIFGSACVDHDGSMYYRMGFGHGDAQHVSKMCATCHRLLRVVCSRGDHKSLWIRARNLGR